MEKSESVFVGCQIVRKLCAKFCNLQLISDEPETAGMLLCMEDLWDNFSKTFEKVKVL